MEPAENSPPEADKCDMSVTTAPAVLFPWREAYSVAIPQIDQQHKQLIKLINDMHAAMLAGNGRTTVAGILNELVRYTESHFAAEEALLRERGYSRLAAHQAEHRRLFGQVRELQEKSVAGTFTASMEVMKFLKDWLANHILSNDLAYAREFAKSATPVR